ncbi:MAG: ferredoxin--NADP reductase [Acidobacteriota bacterium]|jgi:ferredoxin--NADP+ reductase
MGVDLNAVVTRIERVAPGLMILQVAPDGWELPDFKPGQFAVIGLPGSAPRCPEANGEEQPPAPDKLLRRSYSIASSSRQKEYLELYVALVRSGGLSPRLFALREGDRLWLSPKVSGLFTLDQVPADANLVLVATGTGLAPYVSMLRSRLLEESTRRVAVIHGARHSWDLGYRDELTAMQRTFPHLAYIPVVSRPDEEVSPWPGFAGRVQDAWRGGEVARQWGFPPHPDHTHILLCGNPEMVEVMTALLESEGYRQHTRSSPGHIHTEKYW